ncbi:helix-turn-helix domain-containing protein [Dyella psychrodurans]|uniref:Helix-turn-helix domain-containing protein n=1 Tax=Dyella psychrodurans TaxID=1927960 RepID=A0A370XC21_9GAMM|nr:helix-turn-helix transcriptional regulator [Dyella psychrodurans]RDS85791.1 helix-turn-helix domain-containing protein [Dyella psychrodurans]
MAAARKSTKRALKSLYRSENQVFLATLRALRQGQGLTQVQLAEKLGRNQNFVTAAERGVVRLDGLQLRDWCLACDSNLIAWATEIERQLRAEQRRVSTRKAKK